MEKVLTQNCAVFKSNIFNTSVTKEYFINPSCFGDDVARWLISELRVHGHQTDEAPDQEDFGWYFKFDAAGIAHNAVIAYRPGSNGYEGEWICWIERKVGLVGVMLGRRRKVMPEAMKAIQDILTSSQAVLQVRFCRDQDL